MYAIEIRALVKRFRPPAGWGDLLLRGRLRKAPLTALDGVDLVVRPGELVGLAGPNGAGKSTLLRSAAGLLLPESGAIRIHGLDPETAGLPLRRLVGLSLSEERSHFWRLTGRENLRFFASLHGLVGRVRDDRVAELLDLVELGAAVDRTVREYSTGMRQRLSLARGLLGDPRVLLLDEPTRGLDPGGAARIRRFVRDELVGRRGTTVLYATHHLEEMRDLCPRLIVLHQGRVAGDGPFDALGAVFGAVFGT